MRITYDAEVDALYIYLMETQTTVTTEHVADRICLDYAADGRVAGIEVLDAQGRFGDLTQWLCHDTEADVLYVNFKKTSYATDSELTDDDVIIRYEGEEIVGFTILHASER